MVAAWWLAASCVALVAGPAGAQTTARDSTATLVWTAPGDDGDVGRAARYEMRFSNTAIGGTDTLSWWNAAATVGGMPLPGAPGATDSVVVRGLDPKVRWYFVLRTADEVPNWSDFSNVAVRAPYVDLIPPAMITDLGVGTEAIRPTLPSSLQRDPPLRR